MKKEIDLSYKKALELLRKNSTNSGFLASNNNKTNYKRIWSRDGVVIGLASLMSDDKELVSVFKENLKTLKKYQDKKTGRIPSNVGVVSGNVSYGTLVGKIDSTLWYVIGIGQYFKYTKDKKFLREFKDSLKKALEYLDCLELNDKGLLYIPTGGDWADEYVTHGYVLFDEILYLQALKESEFIFKKLNKISKSKEIKKKISFLRKSIEINFFPLKSKINNKQVYNKNLYLKLIKEFNKKYALSYFSSDGCSENLDSFANSLFLLMNLGSVKEKEQILKNMLSVLNKQKIKIIPAFWPPITSKNQFLFDILKTNSLFEFRNKPGFYHNGGLWPLVQGFFIFSLVKQGEKKKARELLEEFSKNLKKDNYEFHEYFDSNQYKPRGIKEMGFSASGYIIAYLSVIKNKKIFRES
ncbi:MAG: glycoside hydrolase 100 family protein [Nanoarchaeota archaeon]